ncbi:hypothetical protein EDD17DRAFT_637463 [Pisolithus thermaeus]|nr:hypothetical protein EDD17DRAFT_637463 [Pisolithus thermaeus]
MFFMIFWRGVKLPWEWSCSAFGRVVLRDSALSPLIVSLLKLAMVLCNTDVIRTSLNGNIIYYWLFCTMWISLGRITVDHSKAALLEELKESAGARRGELTSEIDVEETSSSISESRTSQDPSVDPTSTSEVRIALEALKGRDPSNGAFSFAVAKCGEESPSSGSSDGEDVNP